MLTGFFGNVSEKTYVSNQKFKYRPCAIVKFKIQKEKKDNKYSKEKARQSIAKEAQMTVPEIVRIEKGEIPTCSQLHKLAKNLKWSIFFILGIDENSYKQREHLFFKRLGIANPNMEERKAFQDFYERLLIVKYEEARGGEGARE